MSSAQLKTASFARIEQAKELSQADKAGDPPVPRLPEKTHGVYDKEKSAMKYYLYISDAKVDMLLPQIPHEVKKRIATEFKFDLKLLSASRKTETESDDNRFTRLEAVVAFIREYGNLGSIDQPNEYVEGSLEMRWGPYIKEYSDKESPLIYFGGATEQTIVGLGGSAKHILGNTSLSPAYSHSATPFLVYRLVKELGLDLESESPAGNLVENTPLNQYDSDYWSLRAVELATTQMKGPKQQVEFVAKRLLYGNGHFKKKKVLLATPLYVAMIE